MTALLLSPPQLQPGASVALFRAKAVPGLRDEGPASAAPLPIARSPRGEHGAAIVCPGGGRPAMRRIRPRKQRPFPQLGVGGGSHRAGGERSIGPSEDVVDAGE
jgi:hypothetical protein